MVMLFVIESLELVSGDAASSPLRPPSQKRGFGLDLC